MERRRLKDNIIDIIWRSTAKNWLYKHWNLQLRQRKSQRCDPTVLSLNAKAYLTGRNSWCLQGATTYSARVYTNILRIMFAAVKICIVCHGEYAGINNTHSFKCYTWRDEENKSESVPAVVKTSSHLRDLSDGWDKNSVSNLLWPQQLLFWREREKKKGEDWIWTMKEKVITCTQSQTGLEKNKKKFQVD